MTRNLVWTHDHFLIALFASQAEAELFSLQFQVYVVSSETNGRLLSWMGNLGHLTLVMFGHCGISICNL
jgi:hypothetical protein